MGAVRYLCITIFLVFLCSVQALELDAETSPMPAFCGANGRGRLIAGGKCLCVSGWGGELCETDVLGTASCAVVTADQLDKIKLYPDLSTKEDKIDFTENIMTLNIYGDYVANRNYTSVTFVGQAEDMCNLGAAASVWGIAADNVECKDKIHLRLPWAKHTPCGFVKTANTAHHYQYKATIKLSYTDEVGVVYDKPDETVEANRKIALQRHTTVSYEVFIRFLRRVEVNVTEVLVQSVVNQRVAITAVLYNPDTQEVQIDVAVFTVWPNMLLDDNDHDVTVYAPDGVALRSSTATSQDIDCPLTAVGTAQPQCYQRLTFFIDMKDSCSFDGDYTLTSTVVTCRADYPTCTKNITYIGFMIDSSNVCGEVTAEPMVSGKLVAFEDADHTLPTTNFLLGEYGYFATEFTSVNTVSMSYISIWVTEVDSNGDETGDDIYLYQNFKTVTDYSSYDPEITNPYADEGHGPTRLMINELSVNDDPKVADDVVVKTPHFSFLFHSAIFTTPAGGRKVYNVHATGNVTYLGNEQYNKQKREQTVVNFVWKVDTATLDSSVQVGVASKASAQVAGPQSSNNVSVLAAVLPVAGVALVAIVGAAVVAAIVVKRRKAATSFQTFNSIAIN